MIMFGNELFGLLSILQDLFFCELKFAVSENIFQKPKRHTVFAGV